MLNTKGGTSPYVSGQEADNIRLIFFNKETLIPSFAYGTVPLLCPSCSSHALGRNIFYNYQGVSYHGSLGFTNCVSCGKNLSLSDGDTRPPVQVDGTIIDLDDLYGLTNPVVSQLLKQYGFSPEKYFYTLTELTEFLESCRGSKTEEYHCSELYLPDIVQRFRKLCTLEFPREKMSGKLHEPSASAVSDECVPDDSGAAADSALIDWEQEAPVSIWITYHKEKWHVSFISGPIPIYCSGCGRKALSPGELFPYSGGRYGQVTSIQCVHCRCEIHVTDGDHIGSLIYMNKKPYDYTAIYSIDQAESIVQLLLLFGCEAEPDGWGVSLNSIVNLLEQRARTVHVDLPEFCPRTTEPPVVSRWKQLRGVLSLLVDRSISANPKTDTAHPDVQPSKTRAAVSRSERSSRKSGISKVHLCPQCGRKGFVWDRRYCSYCGADPENQKAPAPDRTERSKKRSRTISAGKYLSSESDCPQCGKKGFRWKREYCSYCGFESEFPLSPGDSVKRRETDELLNEQWDSFYCSSGNNPQNSERVPPEISNSALFKAVGAGRRRMGLISWSMFKRWFRL